MVLIMMVMLMLRRSKMSSGRSGRGRRNRGGGRVEIRVEAVKVQVWRKELVLCLEESVTEFCHEQFTPSNMFVVMPS